MFVSLLNVVCKESGNNNKSNNTNPIKIWRRVLYRIWVFLKQMQRHCTSGYKLSTESILKFSESIHIPQSLERESRCIDGSIFFPTRSNHATDIVAPLQTYFQQKL